MEKTIYAEEYRLLLEWLRNQRRKKGLTMRDVAKRLNVHHSWICRIEQGERRRDIMEFARLCDGVKCDPREGLKFVIPTSGKTRLKKVAESRSQYRRNSHTESKRQDENIVTAHNRTATQP